MREFPGGEATERFSTISTALFSETILEIVLRKQGLKQYTPPAPAHEFKESVLRLIWPKLKRLLGEWRAIPTRESKPGTKVHQVQRLRTTALIGHNDPILAYREFKSILRGHCKSHLKQERPIPIIHE